MSQEPERERKCSDAEGSQPGKPFSMSVEHGTLNVALEKLCRVKWVFFRVRREPGRAGGADPPGRLPSVGPQVSDPEGAGAALVPL